MDAIGDGRLALLYEYTRGVHYSFIEAVRRANEALRQRDYYRARALEAACALREAQGDCPDDAGDPCPRAFGLFCRACCEEIDKGARYL